MRPFLVVTVALLCCMTAKAENWTTNDGKTYQGVKVLKVEADAVTFLDDDGGARVALSDLPPDLQKRFNYDAVKAKAAADVRAKEDVENAARLQAEMNQAQALKKQQQIGAGNKSITGKQVAAIQARVGRLELDISKCQQKQATLTEQELKGWGWQYGEEIRQDKVAIEALQAQLQ